MAHQTGQLCHYNSRVKWIEPEELRYCALDKSILLEAELPHHPDGMILNTLIEPRQHNQSHVTSAEEDSERLSSGRDDAPGYRILGQLC